MAWRVRPPGSETSLCDSHICANPQKAHPQRDPPVNYGLWVVLVCPLVLGTDEHTARGEEGCMCWGSGYMGNFCTFPSDPKSTLESKVVTKELLQHFKFIRCCWISTQQSQCRQKRTRIFLEVLVDHGSLSKFPRVMFVWHFGFGNSFRVGR